MVTEEGNPLLAELSPEQLKLLETVWGPIPLASRSGKVPAWPTWDYVAGTLYRSFPRLRSAESVLGSLPRLSQATWTGNDYGLAWLSETTMSGPPPQARVGLSIAGLAQLSRAQKIPATVVDELVNIVEALARRESKLAPLPDCVVTDDAPLTEYLGWFIQVDRMKPYSIPLGIVQPVLEHEFPRLIVSEDGFVHLGGHWLRPLIGVGNADAYLAYIADDVDQRESPGFAATPLTLVQTFDYLSLVLANRQVWEQSGLMVQAPDLESAATLMGEVRTKDDFNQRLLALCSIIAHLKVPAVPEGGSKRGTQERAGTLNALQYWLDRYLQDQSSCDRVDTALGALRDCVHLRNLAGHMNQATRAKAVKSQRRLGLPEFISDWPDAWQTVQERAASALDVIRREVQSSSTGEGHL